MLLQEAHAGCFAGHFAFKKVYDHLRRCYWWKGMRADVHHFCRSCFVCASRKGPFRPPLTPYRGRSVSSSRCGCVAIATDCEWQSVLCVLLTTGRSG